MQAKRSQLIINNETKRLDVESNRLQRERDGNFKRKVLHPVMHFKAENLMFQDVIYCYAMPEREKRLLSGKSLSSGTHRDIERKAQWREGFSLPKSIITISATLTNPKKIS